MTEVLRTTFLLRRGLEEAWLRNNPVLATGEPGFVIDKNILKIGDGVTHWKDLPPITGDSDGSGCVFNAKTRYEFPNIGKENVLYKAEEERKIYQWNTTNLKYEALNEVEISIDNIKLIYGGNANGTT